MSTRGIGAALVMIVAGALIAACGAVESPVPTTAASAPAPVAAAEPSASATATPAPTTAQAATPWGWSVTGNSKMSPEHDTATLLRDGRVLVAGGGAGVPVADAELYDPRTRAWTATGSLTATRRFHTALLLGDGRVLASGGLDGPGGEGTKSLASTELYDPGTGTWEATRPLITPRDHHTATALGDGRVLVVGGAEAAKGIRGDGLYGGRVLASAELFDPVTGTWSVTGGLAMAREAHFAVLLRSGKVLVVGGESGGTSRASSAELYDPTAGRWVEAGNPGIANIATATLLANGEVLVTGSVAGRKSGVAALYDPLGGTWTATGNLIVGRSDDTATLLPTGRVLVAGGQSTDQRTLASAEIFDPDSGVWTPTGKMSARREWHTAVVLADGSVMVVGGEQLPPGPHLFLDSAEIYGPVR
jgi:hypothetical protein